MASLYWGGEPEEKIFTKDELNNLLSPDGNVLAKGDAVEQCRIIFGRIEKALNEANTALSDVVRTRIFATRAKDCDSIMKVHGEFFKDIRPAATLVVVHELVNPEMLLEVEVEAIIE